MTMRSGRWGWGGKLTGLMVRGSLRENLARFS